MSEQNVVIFRCEAGPGLGFGHFMRCLAIYEELEIRNWQCYFAMNKQSASQPLVQAYQKTIFIIPDNKHLNPLALKRLYPAGVSWLVLDNYDFDSTFAAGIDGWARSIAWFQDLPEQDVAANFVIGHESPHALSVFGPDFIPLRSSVRELRNKLSAADEPEAHGNATPQALCNCTTSCPSCGQKSVVELLTESVHGSPPLYFGIAH